MSFLMQTNKMMRPLFAGLMFAGLAACATAPTKDELAYEAALKDRELVPASADQRAQVKTQDPMTQAAFWGIEYEKSPGDVEAATEFAKALRGIGSGPRASEVASQTLSLAPDNIELLTLLGKSLLSQGNATGAVDILRRAWSINPEDTSVLGALAVAYDQTGRHREAQSTYRKVLQREPDNAANLSNLGLSLALTGEPEEAETLLRRAINQPAAGARERQNLALVLSLQGKFEEAREIGSEDLSDKRVDQNIDYFRAMLTPQARRYGELRGTTN